jgi:hypothetical protein
MHESPVSGDKKESRSFFKKKQKLFRLDMGAAPSHSQQFLETVFQKTACFLRLRLSRIAPRKTPAHPSFYSPRWPESP